jgi:hypothetical protein
VFSLRDGKAAPLARARRGIAGCVVKRGTVSISPVLAGTLLDWLRMTIREQREAQEEACGDCRYEAVPRSGGKYRTIHTRYCLALQEEVRMLERDAEALADAMQKAKVPS